MVQGSPFIYDGPSTPSHSVYYDPNMYYTIIWEGFIIYTKRDINLLDPIIFFKCIYIIVCTGAATGFQPGGGQDFKEQKILKKEQKIHVRSKIIYARSALYLRAKRVIFARESRYICANFLLPPP